MMNFQKIKPEVSKPIFGKYLSYIEKKDIQGLDKNALTQHIQNQIDQCSRSGGGRVILTRGLYTIKPIVLKSGVNLHLESGVFLQFSGEYEDYEVIMTSFEGLDTYRCVSPIFAVDQENIGITGKGIIDGNGFRWRPVKQYKVTPVQWEDLVNSGGCLNDKKDMWWPTKAAYDAQTFFMDSGCRFSNREDAEKYKVYARPNMIQLSGCKNVLLQGVTFQNSAAWNVHPLMCENVIIEDVNIKNPSYSQNGDGLDLESCKNVLVTGTTFDVGDDAICMKSGKDEDGRKRGIPSENIWIDDCTVYHGHGGFVVGSEMSGGIKDIYVSNCTFIGTDVGIRFKSCRGRGGIVENIFIENINMLDIVNEAIIFTTYYQDYNNEHSQEAIDKDETTPEFRNIYIKDTICHGSQTPLHICGLPEQPIHHLTFDNINVTGEEEAMMLNSQDITFIDSKINGKEA